jgi:hypothetical protein
MQDKDCKYGIHPVCPAVNSGQCRLQGNYIVSGGTIEQDRYF